MPKTVNQILLERGISHAVHVVRLAGGEANWVASKMPELRKAIEEAITPIVSQIDAREVLSVSDSMMIDEASNKAAKAAEDFFSQMSAEARQRMTNIAVSEADFEQRLFQKHVPIQRNFNRPSDTFLQSFMDREAISGKTMKDWFKKMPDDIRLGVNNQIREGMIAGEPQNDIMRRVRGRREAGFKDGIIGRKGREAANLVRTGTMRASNEARAAFHDANNDVIKGYQVVLTLDTATCMICIDWESGNVYNIDQRPHPPFHVMCRCVVVPAIKSWEELGIDLEEAEPGTRRTMDGEVPESMTYEQWFNQQSPERQLDILGPSRYEAYQKGVGVTSFADNGKIYSLDDLQRINDIELGQVPAGDIFDQTGPRLTDLDAHNQQIADYFSADQHMDERAALEMYTGRQYEVVNKELRTGALGTGASNTKQTVADLDKFFSKAPRYQGVSYRGMGGDMEMMRQFKRGSIITMDAYTSTSVDFGVAESFAKKGSKGILFEIKGKNGVSMNPISFRPEESEILFNRGTRFKFLGLENRGSHYYVNLEEI